MSDTPRTDEQERALGLAWFGLRDQLGRAQDESAKYRELARTLERELAEAQSKRAETLRLAEGWRDQHSRELAEAEVAAEAQFAAGMEAAAQLLDQEAASAESLSAEFSACDLKGRMELVREHMQTMAGTVRHFAADAEWRKEAIDATVIGA